jgi:hypothetical protein
MGWKRLLAYITGSVDQELLLRNEYLVTENRLLRKQIPGRVRLSDGERKTLAEIGKQLPGFSAKYPPVHVLGKGPQSLAGAPPPGDAKGRSGH